MDHVQAASGPLSALTVWQALLSCEYNWDPQTGHLECPCYGSVYAMDGKGKMPGGPAPRALDTLPTKVQCGDLYVEWQASKAGIPQKVSA